jgi:hypothetical protein
MRTTCGTCGKGNEICTPVGSKGTPGEGDLNVCAYCGCISRFNKNSESVPLTSQEQHELYKVHPELMAKALRAQQFFLSDEMQSKFNNAKQKL